MDKELANKIQMEQGDEADDEESSEQSEQSAEDKSETSEQVEQPEQTNEDEETSEQTEQAAQAERAEVQGQSEITEQKQPAQMQDTQQPSPSKDSSQPALADKGKEPVNPLSPSSIPSPLICPRQKEKEKHRPTPIKTTSTASAPLASSSSITPAKITPEDQKNVMDSSALGQYAPSAGAMIDPILERDHRRLLDEAAAASAQAGPSTGPQTRLATDADAEDEYYDVLRLLSGVQRGLLGTLGQEHRVRVLEALRDDVLEREGEDVGDVGDAELKAMIMRYKEE